MIRNLSQELSATTYPGRGIVLGKSDDGKYMVIAYFIMGRSENSRNRIFETTREGIRTKAFDETKMVDPSLIIYNPVRVFDGYTIVTNGDQTDTIYEFLKAGRSFEDALKTRTFEPDAPNFTPRISGLVDYKNDRLCLSILKSDDGNPDCPLRFFYEYNFVPAGTGYFIHTYQKDGNPLPSFEGEPKKVTTGVDIDSFTKTIWASLDNENKVSLFTRFISLETEESETRIVNKNL
ncbi:MAG: inosine monophosphate cyclohydrolase [Clostridiales bacterium]|jgi:IMP cyclohydrolase|nr:inosine monophosphate cyclohydrolase [Clostridiales bacterium]